MAVIVCLNIYYLRVLPCLLLFKSATYTPGVSITDASPFKIENYFRSRVVP